MSVPGFKGTLTDRSIIMESKKTKPKKKEKSNKRRVIRFTIQASILIILVLILAGIAFFYHKYGRTLLNLQSEAKKLVDASTKDTFKASQTSQVYDSDGKVISTLRTEKDVYYVLYQDIPAAFIDAMIVTEDRKFMEHHGVDYLANLRAAIALIRHGGQITQGASTITQQLSRNVFLTNKVSYMRKIEEIYIAQNLERKYSKYDILEFYLNNIYFANGYYGIQAASKGYFGKGVDKLSLSQTAFLCAIPNSPNLYNPRTNFDNTMKRRDRILEQLLQEKMISQEEYDQAIAAKIKLKIQKNGKNNYVDTYVKYCAVRALMESRGFQIRNFFQDDADKEAYDQEYSDLYTSCQKELFTGGYHIYTSIDSKKQKTLQQSVDDALKDFTDVNEDGVYELQGAAVSIDNANGKIVAVVGGRDQDLGEATLNRAYQSFRQPGSSIKPLIVYTPSFERNYTLNSIVEDKYEKDGPKNSGGDYAGKITIQRAIQDSRNTVAWKLFKELGPTVGLSYILNMNFSKITDSDYNLAAALGGLTVGVSPLEMASAYATLENDGLYREPTCIVKILNSSGTVIVDGEKEAKQVYTTRAARMMTEALMGVIKKGTAKGLGLSHTVSAGKTGTTNATKDGWFVGYTPYYTTSVWVGFDMPKTLQGLAGATYPGRIWHNYMDEIHDAAMTDTFQLYDWKSELKEDEEEVEEEEEATPTPTPEVTDPVETPDDQQSEDDQTDPEIPEGTETPENPSDITQEPVAEEEEDNMPEDPDNTEGEEGPIPTETADITPNAME